MRFKHYDKLRTFNIVAKHGSFSAAADDLSLTKGAVSYQLKRLEEELGFALFRRLPRGVALTSRGQELRDTCRSAFDSVESKIYELRETSDRTLTIGVSTYFASRWLSSRLMLFMNSHPAIRLRIQPMIDLVDLRGESVDLVIRWGKGDWTDMAIELLFLCPAFPTASPGMALLIREVGLEAGLTQVTFLKDREGSRAWEDWHAVVEFPYKERTDTLIVPDPNVRVQAVIDGQGVALFDALVSPEIEAGRLSRVSSHQLDDYGYFLAFLPGALSDANVEAFSNWLLQEGSVTRKLL